MPDDNYSDDPGSAPQPDESEGGGQSPKTALLPKDCCPGCKPGDTITCKVVRVHENEVEVEPDCKGGGEESAPPDEGAQPEGGDHGPMRSMLED